MALYKPFLNENDPKYNGESMIFFVRKLMTPYRVDLTFKILIFFLGKFTHTLG